MAVVVIPLPDGYRAIPELLRPLHPPLFDCEGSPSLEDVRLALALIAALDAESRAWYAAAQARLDALLADA